MTFSSDLARFAEKAGLNTDTVVRKTTLDLARSVVQNSPVDTGRFRANWQLGEDSPPQGTLNEFDKSGSTYAKLAVQAAGIKAGGVIFLVNNLPYAIPLEYGYSKQAPSGMARLAVSRYQKYIRDAVAQLG